MNIEFLFHGASLGPMLTQRVRIEVGTMEFRVCKEAYWSRRNGNGGVVPRFKGTKRGRTMWNYALIADKTHGNLIETSNAVTT
jgi:hypothetical protein